MPTIMEIKEIDGAMWARLDINLDSTDQPVHLLVDSEIQAIRESVMRACADVADEVAADAGVAGASAQIVANKLRAAAKTNS